MSDADQLLSDLDDFIVHEMSARHLMGLAACIVKDDRLVCVKCGRRYPVRDGIPVMLVEEAELPGKGNAQ